MEITDYLCGAVDLVAEFESRRAYAKAHPPDPKPPETMIKVWRFNDAPKALQDLSTNGGDEDWLAVIPANYDEYIPWLESGSPFGCCCVDAYELPTGETVYIGSHS